MRGISAEVRAVIGRWTYDASHATAPTDAKRKGLGPTTEATTDSTFPRPGQTYRRISPATVHG